MSMNQTAYYRAEQAERRRLAERAKRGWLAAEGTESRRTGNTVAESGGAS